MRRKADPFKVTLAKKLRSETSMVWIAHRLEMGTRGHLSHLLYWNGKGPEALDVQQPLDPNFLTRDDTTIDTCYVLRMNAYLFSAGTTSSQMRPSPGHYGGTSLQTWDACVSAIIYGGSTEQAQNVFEAWCRRTPEGENPVVTEIKKLVGAQFIDSLPGLTRTRPTLIQSADLSDCKNGQRT